MHTIDTDNTANVSLDRAKCIEFGYGFETVSDAASYIDGGLRFLAEHMHDEEYSNRCETWLECMMEVSDCIILWN